MAADDRLGRRPYDSAKTGRVLAALEIPVYSVVAPLPAFGPVAAAV